MKNYALLLRATKEMSPESFSDPKEVELRAKWLAEIKGKNIIVNEGGTMPPMATMATALFANGESVEGAFSEQIYFLTGYLIIKSDDLEAAKKIASTNPILKAGGSVEVREIMLR